MNITWLILNHVYNWIGVESCIQNYHEIYMLLALLKTVE